MHFRMRRLFLPLLLAFAAAVARGGEAEAHFDNLAEALRDQAAAARKLRDFVMDESAYPFPEKARTGWTPGVDHQPGQEEMERRMAAALAAHRRLSKAIWIVLGLPPADWSDTVRPPRAATVGEHVFDLYSNLRHVQRYEASDASPPCPAGAVAPGPMHARFDPLRAFFMPESIVLAGPWPVPYSTPFAKDMLAATIAVLPFDQKQMSMLRHHTENRAILDGNSREYTRIAPGMNTGSGDWSAGLETAWSEDEAAILKLINRLRRVAGVTPLVADRRLQKAAQEHAEWMAKHERLSHYRPEKEKRTFVERLQSVGVDDPGGENLAGMPGVAAVWSWRTDAGHHRNLLHPDWRAAGVGQAGDYVCFVASRSAESAER